ncbi:MAG: hypothetical protein KC657_18765 [Myxococcales bacterium]|nr:hypothetical protein [Myxococcales bacterium]
MLALVAVVHLPLLAFRLVYDDWWTIAANGFLRAPQLALLLSPEAVAQHVPDAFRPTLVVFDVITYQLCGLSAPLHHALSIALHVAVCWLAQRWLALLGAPLQLRAATLALYGLLAVHAEAVAVVSFREDLLAALVGLFGLVLASMFIRSGKWGPLALAALCSALACGAKLSAAALPGLWLLGEVLQPWDRRPAPRRRLIAGALALALGVALALAHTWLLHGGLSPYADSPRLEAHRAGYAAVLAASTQIHLGYLQQIVAPFGLSPEYVDFGARWTDPATLLASAALLALLVFGAANARRRPVVAFAILGAFALALPTSNLVAIPNMRADRFLYLPSLPACVGLCAAALALGRRLAAWRPALELAPLVVLVVVQGAVRLGAAHSYRNGVQLWTDALAQAPGSARAHALYAEGLLANADPSDRGEIAHELLLARVEAHCLRARDLDPDDALGHVCLARLALIREAWAAAHDQWLRALAKSSERNARILAALALHSLDLPGLSASQRPQLAAEYVARGLREYPFVPEVWATAGRIAHLTGAATEADAHYQRAYALAPERLQTALWGLELALDLGDAAAARKIWVRDRKVLDRAPTARRMELLLRTHEAARLFPSSAQASMLDHGARDDP